MQSKDPLVDQLIKHRLASAPVVTEWCLLPKGTDPRSYYEKGLHDVVKYHVSMTSSCDFADTDSITSMDPEPYTSCGHKPTRPPAIGTRSRRGKRSQSIHGKVATISVAWTNSGSAAATEQWAPGYQLVDFSGAVVRTLPAAVNLKTLVHDDYSQSPFDANPVSYTESVYIDPAGLAPGHYTLRTSVAWQQHKPGASHVVNYSPMQLDLDGRDDSGWYPIATLDVIPPDVLTSVPRQ